MAISTWGRVGVISLGEHFIKFKTGSILMKAEDLDYFCFLVKHCCLEGYSFFIYFNCYLFNKYLLAEAICSNGLRPRANHGGGYWGRNGAKARPPSQIHEVSLAPFLLSFLSTLEPL